MVNRPAAMPVNPQGYGPLLLFDLYSDDGHGTCRNLSKGHSMEMAFDVKASLPPTVTADGEIDAEVARGAFIAALQEGNIYIFPE